MNLAKYCHCVCVCVCLFSKQHTLSWSVSSATRKQNLKKERKREKTGLKCLLAGMVDSFNGLVMNQWIQLFGPNNNVDDDCIGDGG